MAHQVLRSAATVDPEAAELLENNRRERADGQARVVQGLRMRKALRPGLGPARALDIVYALMSPELHRVLTVDRGWDDQEYEQWLGDALCAALLTDTE
jgi:hypothetical protein